jgi:hypothetical protein
VAAVEVGALHAERPWRKEPLTGRITLTAFPVFLRFILRRTIPGPASLPLALALGA